MRSLFGICEVIAIPYRSFKERIRLAKYYEKNYKIEILNGKDQEGVLYMTKRGEAGA